LCTSSRHTESAYLFCQDAGQTLSSYVFHALKHAILVPSRA
jgi:hypothetical protein